MTNGTNMMVSGGGSKYVFTAGFVNFAYTLIDYCH